MKEKENQISRIERGARRKDYRGCVEWLKDAEEDVLVRQNLGIRKGGFFENVIGDALVKAGVELVYYKCDNSSLEMDFFLRSKNCLVPIEVLR